MKEIVGYFFKSRSEINEKGLVKMVQGTKKTTLHYIRNSTGVLALTRASSKKVERLREGIPTQLGFIQSGKDLVDSSVRLIDDRTEVKKVFDRMADMKFTHFKKFHDDLVLLQMNFA